MSRFVVFLAIVLTASADDELDIKKCNSIVASVKHCCKTNLFNQSLELDDNIKECRRMPAIPGSCDTAICFGTKLGFGTPDGKLKVDKFQEHLEEKLSDQKDILENIKKGCLDDKYKSFGESDECELIQIKKCFLWQFLFNCQDISDEESCRNFKDVSAKCIALKP